MPPVLHVLPFSTYSEKALWALKCAGIEPDVRSYLPGPHARKVKAVSGQTSVPVLEVPGQVVAGSNEIAAFAHASNPNAGLIPDRHRAEIMDWQAEFDQMGHVLRATFVLALKDRPKAIRDILTGGALVGRVSLYRTLFPLIGSILQRSSRSAAPDLSAAWEASQALLARACEAAGSSGYIVGESFTLADLTAAALYHPVVLPEGALGADYARTRPEMALWQDRWAGHPGRAYVERIYCDHR